MTPSQFDPEIHHRRSIRLQGYDYSRAGAYFVTVVTYQRETLFGEIVDGEMKLNQFGKIVDHAWHDLPHHYGHIELGNFCIMPNHVHAIIALIDDSRGGSVGNTKLSSQKQETRPYKTIKRHALPEIVRALKSFSARRINAMRNTPGIPVWQRNYGACPECSEGNTSSATTARWIISGVTSNPTHPCGRTMTKTR